MLVNLSKTISHVTFSVHGKYVKLPLYLTWYDVFITYSRSFSISYSNIL